MINSFKEIFHSARGFKKIHTVNECSQSFRIKLICKNSIYTKLFMSTFTAMGSAIRGSEEGQ